MDYRFRLVIYSLIVWCSLLLYGVASAQSLTGAPPYVFDPGLGVALPKAAPGLSSRTAPFRILIDAPNVSKFIYGVDMSGDVKATGGGVFNTSSGARSITVAGSIPKGSVAAALGRFAGRAVPVVSTAYALYSLADELGFVAYSGPDGSTDFKKLLEGASEEYRVVHQWNTAAITPWSSTEIGACTAYTSLDHSPYLLTNPRISSDGSSPPIVKCTWDRKEANSQNNFVIFDEGSGFVKRPSATASEQLISDQQFADAVAAKSGWPTSSTLAAATAAAIAAGEVVDVIPRIITGAPTEGPTNTTVRDDPATNTEITTDTKDSYYPKPSEVPYSPITGTPSYSPGTGTPTSVSPSPPFFGKPVLIEIIERKTETKKDKATGDKTVTTIETGPGTETQPNPNTSSPTATETADLCEKHPDIVACAPASKLDPWPDLCEKHPTIPACQASPDLCEKHPNIPACKASPGLCAEYPDIKACEPKDENDVPDSPDLETKDKEVSITPEEFGGGGSCPAPVHIPGANVDFEYTEYCNFFTGLKPILIAVAWVIAGAILIGARGGAAE